VQYNRDRLIIVKRRPEKYSLSSRRNVVSDGAFLTDDGRLFHARAEPWKARSLSVERLVVYDTFVTGPNSNISSPYMTVDR